MSGSIPNKPLSRRHLLKLLGGGLGALASANASAQLLKMIGRGRLSDDLLTLSPNEIVANLDRLMDPVGTWGRPEPAIYPRGFFPGTAKSFKVLEIHLYGGLSPWENFYHRNRDDGRGYRGFGSGNTAVSDLNWQDIDPNEPPDLCAFVPDQNTEPLQFARTSGPQAHDVHFGPMTKPLWSENDHILDRTCVVVMQHNLLPHEAAVPYSATGFRLGQARMAGLGAVIQNRAIAIQQSAPLLISRTVPWSYILEKTTNIAMSDNIDAYRATGLLSGASKPVSLQIGNSDLIGQLRGRKIRSREGEKDELLKFYRDAYRKQLTRPDNMEFTRSSSFGDYNASLNTALNSESLVTLLEGAIQGVDLDRHCVTLNNFGSSRNSTAAGIRSAAKLLNHPLAPAQYACVIDNGFGSGGDGYDTHASHTARTSRNLWNTLAVLRQLIDDDELNLDNTLVVLNTEFGRTPYRGEDNNGRDHWPQGYVNVMIGGPIRSRKILGHIQDGDFVSEGGNNGFADPNNVYNASDGRAAIMLAAGINPFENGLFGGGDVSGPLRQGEGNNLSANDNTSKRIVETFFM